MFVAGASVIFLHAAGEWYFEHDTFRLYLYPNTTTTISPAALDISLPVLKTLISIIGSKTDSVAGQAYDIEFVGFEFSQTRSTFMSEPYEVPSAGGAIMNVDQGNVCPTSLPQTACHL